MSVSCTEAVYQYASFHGATSTVHWSVTSNGTVVGAGDFTFSGSGVTKRIPLNIYGDRTLVAKTWWEVEGGNQASATAHVQCATPPTPTPAPAPAVSPPAPAPAPASGVQGVSVSSPAAPARATLATRASCKSKMVRASVSGRGIRRVTFSVNGRVVRTVTPRAGQRRVTVPLRRRGSGPQAVTVRVRFANRTQVLTARASRCAQAQVQPQFTG